MHKLCSFTFLFQQKPTSILAQQKKLVASSIMASHRGFLSLLKAASPFRKALINSNFSRGPASLRRTATRPLFHWPGICKDLKVNNHCTFEWFVSKTVFVDYTQGYSSQVKKTKWMGTVLLNRSKVGWFQCKLHDVAWSIMKLPSGAVGQLQSIQSLLPPLRSHPPLTRWWRHPLHRHP